MKLHSKSPPIFPASWANEWGEDEYGLWMAFSYQGHRHAFRWIPPGSFMMGSPEDEKGRPDNETQRKVTFETGFWLGEFPVTQGLYQAVIGENPSHFKDKQNSEALPVEKVSWLDAQKFTSALNQLHPELNTYLPFEAQWEYACRAGTTTAFWFGDEIDLEKANYGGVEDKGRKQTNALGDYPANPWGLFDMHGNVLEWCLEPYQAKNEMRSILEPGQPGPQQDSQSQALTEQDKEQAFPLCGGSWLSLGLRCRSAFRRGFGAGYRDYDFGFRLSLGPELQ